MTEIVGFFESYDDEKLIIIDDEDDEIEIYFKGINEKSINLIKSYVKKRVSFYYDYDIMKIVEIEKDIKQSITCINHNNGDVSLISPIAFLYTL
jgi:hypothetical protein